MRRPAYGSALSVAFDGIGEIGDIGDIGDIGGSDAIAGIDGVTRHPAAPHEYRHSAAKPRHAA